MHAFVEGVPSRSAELGYLRCRFNASVVAATYVNRSALSCIAPPLDGADVGKMAVTGRVPLEVSSNAQDYSSSGIFFEYTAGARVVGVFPTGGPTAGGVLVQVEGDSFAAGAARCSFGGLVVSATVVSPRLARCIAPPARLSLQEREEQQDPAAAPGRPEEFSGRGFLRHRKELRTSTHF